MRPAREASALSTLVKNVCSPSATVSSLTAKSGRYPSGRAGQSDSEARHHLHAVRQRDAEAEYRSGVVRRHHGDSHLPA